MDERKSTIVKEVVREFTNKVKPVSSKTVAEKLNLSSATIRAEMQKLTSDNYLYQPHTSAGRIPTDKGYRCYVDIHLELKNLSEKEEEILQEIVSSIKFHFQEMLQKLSETTSSIIKYISYLKIPIINESEINNIILTKISSYSLLIVIVLKNSLVETRIVDLTKPLAGIDLARIGKSLTDKLYGIKISQISSELLEEIFAQISLNEMMLKRAIHKFVYELCTKELITFIGGEKDILSQPEFKESSSVIPLLNAIEEYLKTQNLLLLEKGKTNICIGAENQIESFFPYSHVQTTFNFEDKSYGFFGIIGPKRMDYDKAVSIALFISEQMSRKIKELYY